MRTGGVVTHPTHGIAKPRGLLLMVRTMRRASHDLP